MIPRFKLVAAVLGLIVAAGSIGNASAATIDRTVVNKTVVSRSVVAPRVRHVVVVPRRPAYHRFVAYRAPVMVRTNVLGPRIVRAPVVVTRHVALRHVALHRTVVHKTVIR